MIMSRAEDGVMFVAGKQHNYFVIYMFDEDFSPVIETGHEIFDRMDLSDCYPIEIRQLFLIDGDQLRACKFRGTWHDGKDPLKMQIENVITGEVYDVGYGSDH